VSREFGDGWGGYFHTKIQNAAEDCRGGRDTLTQLWGKFLEEFAEVAYQIAGSEACDSGPYAPIIETINRLPELRQRLAAIQTYVEPFKDCMEDAVRKAVNEREGEK
jgi:hypothetical protein